MIFYKTLCDLELIADNPSFGVKSQKVISYKDQSFSVIHKQKDFFDSDIEYWTNSFGWIFKINRKDLGNIIESDLS